MTATAGNGSATVNWTPPSSDGGSPITGYTVSTQLTVPGTGLVPSPVTVGPSFGVNITGLTNGASYTFTVSAANANGTGPASAPSNVVTLPTAPSAPTGLQWLVGNGQVVVSWQPPNTDGGSPITSYTVTTVPAVGTGPPPVTVTPAMGSGINSVTIFPLVNGASYIFMVSATNAIGTGLQASTIPLTPIAAPASPNNDSAHAINLGTIDCSGSLPVVTGDNTTGTHAWYTFTFNQSLCTLQIALGGGTGDSVTVHLGTATAAPPTGGSGVTLYDTTPGGGNGTYFIDVSGGTAGNNFNLNVTTH